VFIYFVSLLALLLIGESRAADLPDTTAVQPNLLKANLVLPARYWTDTTNGLSIEQVTSQSFTSAPQREFLLGYSTHPIWLRVTLRQTRAQSTDYLLQLANWFADHVDFYIPRPTGGYRVIRAGDWVAWRDRSPQTRYPAAVFRLTDTLPHTIYVRVSSTQYHSYELRLWRQDAFIRSQLASDTTSFSLGLVIMRIAFQLALLVFLFRYSAFRGYSLYGLSICLAFLVSGGNSSIYFPNSPYLANTSYFVAVALVPIALSYYVYEVFDVRRNFPWMRPILLVISITSLAYLLVNLGGQHAYVTWFFAGFMAITLSFFTVALIGLYIKGPRPVIWYVLPFPVHLIPYAYIYARNAGFLPGTMHEEQLRFTLVVQFLIVPFFVAGMLWQAHRERLRSVHALTLQKTASEQLLELDKLKTRFFTNISHEFRTPLTLILGPLADLKRRFPTEPALAIIEKNGQRLLSLINQLLDLSQLEAGQQQPHPQPGDLAAFFRTMAGSFDSLARSRSIQFVSTQSETECWAFFDADKLEKIVSNLLSNAFRFTDTGQTVQLSVDYQHDTFVTTVRDTGVGIAAVHLTHIFQRFYQANDRRDGGSGIGLALVSELITVLGGSIDADSTEGQGSTFTVVLPLNRISDPSTLAASTVAASTEARQAVWEMNAVEPAVVVASSANNVSSDKQTEPVLLIIDDNADIRTYVHSLFDTGYKVLEAADGLDGLQRAMQYQPDIVICDLMMPRLDGFAFCRVLKSQPATSHIPVVMLTARAAPEDRIEGFELGADDYLTKPFNRVELQTRVRNLIRQRQLLFQRLTASADTVSNVGTDPMPVPVAEQKFIQQLTVAVQQHLDDPTFGVEELAEAASLSRSQLHRKLKALTNTTATLFIRDIRLTKAAELLTAGDLSVTQVAYAVGFDNPSYFAKLFQDRYRTTPSQYVRTRPHPAR
jgi:signal transduction histidine kinase/DNA-binding response OmpR family regulator